MTTGERIKNRRQELGMNAEKLAMEIGKSPATIYRYEKGDIEKVPGPILVEIARVLKTTPSYLMGWEDAAPPPAPDPREERIRKIAAQLAELPEDRLELLLSLLKQK